MQLVAALARIANVTRALDLGSGLGYSTLWIASAIRSRSSVIGIDDDAEHTSRATAIAADAGYPARVSYPTGRAADVLPTIHGPFDMIHDDAWFAKTPEHLDAMISLLRPGGPMTMANWFLLIDTISGSHATTGRPLPDQAGATTCSSTPAYWPTEPISQWSGSRNPDRLRNHAAAGTLRRVKAERTDTPRRSLACQFGRASTIAEQNDVARTLVTGTYRHGRVDSVRMMGSPWSLLARLGVRCVRRRRVGRVRVASRWPLLRTPCLVDGVLAVRTR